MPKPTQAQKVHDRLSRDLPRGARVSIAIVDDPLATVLGEQIQVLRSVRDDPLAGMLSRGQITQHQFNAGREWQRHHENSQLGGLQGFDYRRPAVDGGKPMDPLHDGQLRATDEMSRAIKALGKNGSVLVFDILGKRKSITQAAFDRGLTSDQDIKFVGKRFRECLDTLVDLW